MMKRINALFIKGCLLGIICCLNINAVVGKVDTEQTPAEVDKQLQQVQVHLNAPRSFYNLTYFQQELTRIKKEIDILPASKEKEELEKKFNLLDASLEERKERMSIKAEEAEFPSSLIPGWEEWKIIDEKDLDILVEKFRKIHELYDGYIKKAEDTEYDSEFGWVYEEFKENVREEVIMKVILRGLEAELKIDEDNQKKIEWEIKFRTDQLKDIQEELKKSEVELKEICSKIDRLKKQS